MTPTAVATAADTVASLTMWAAWVQALANIGLLVLAGVAIWWARKEYRQREQHEQARETPHVGVRVAMLAPNTSATLAEVDWSRVNRWWTNYRGTGRNIDWVNQAQRYSCFLTNLGPGTVSSAEVPYKFELFAGPPGPGTKPVEVFDDDVFRFYNVPAGAVHLATSALTTSYFPFFRITLEKPVVRNVRGAVMDQPPDPHASSMTAEFDNAGFWDLLSRMPAPRPDEAPPPSPV